MNEFNTSDTSTTAATLAEKAMSMAMDNKVAAVGGAVAIVAGIGYGAYKGYHAIRVKLLMRKARKSH